MSTLNNGQKHLLRLIRKDSDKEGWTPVSNFVWPAVEGLPSELVEIEKTETGGRARLLPAGEVVINWI